jgi:Fur family ferric uptake transcriptional regulator
VEATVPSSAPPPDALRALLQAHGLRVTAPRLAVLEALQAADRPLSHAELTERLGAVQLDRVTVYRNLDKLVEVGLARLVSREGGAACYEAAGGPQHPAHAHPHFVCTDCGTVSCLPEQPVPPLAADPRWSQALATATLELKGHCPDCATGGPPKR